MVEVYYTVDNQQEVIMDIASFYELIDKNNIPCFKVCKDEYNSFNLMKVKDTYNLSTIINGESIDHFNKSKEEVKDIYKKFYEKINGYIKVRVDSFSVGVIMEGNDIIKVKEAINFMLNNMGDKYIFTKGNEVITAIRLPKNDIYLYYGNENKDGVYNKDAAIIHIKNFFNI